METIEKMMATRRFAYYIPADGYVEGQGYRVSVVFEGVNGHFPTGDWPYTGSPDQKAPWFWGHDLAFAKKVAADQNEKRGVSAEEAFQIVTSSMAAGHRRKRRRSDAGKRRELP